jgi:hypothetical protein
MLWQQEERLAGPTYLPVAVGEAEEIPDDTVG